MTGNWLAPHTRENFAAMRALGFDLRGIDPPGSSGYKIGATSGLLHIQVPHSPVNKEALRRLPDYRMWDGKARAWFAKPTARNLAHLKASFPQAEWDAQAGAWLETHVAAVVARRKEYAAQKAAPLAELEAGDDWKHGGPKPWDHQRRAFLMSRDRPAFALFMEQRTGKTKVLIDTAAYLYTRGKIRQALVIAPNSVKTNWLTDELPTHMPDYVKWRAACWYASPTKTERASLDAAMTGAVPEELVWLVMNVEALSTERAAKAALAFVKRAPTIVIVDESSRIKTPRASRTMAITKLRAWAPYRRIATGTPATQGPLDVYAQMKFLDPTILGFGAYTAFRNHFAIMGGFNGKVVIGYAHLDELQALLDPHSFRITRDECFDIPPKGYQKLVVDMGQDQRRVYDEMARRMKADLGDGKKVTAAIVLTQMLRLQQITGGFVPIDPDLDTWEDAAMASLNGDNVVAIPGRNPKVEAVLELAEETVGKMIIWARFRPEIAAVADALRKEYGDASVVEFHGGIGEDARVKARTAFQDPGSPVRFFVGQTETGGLGINLSQARTVVYVSNSFSLESRLQSEDRPMSAEQKHSVAVVDIIARGTVDEKVVASLRGKQDVARAVTGDKWKDWI